MIEYFNAQIESINIFYIHIYYFSELCTLALNFINNFIKLYSLVYPQQKINKSKRKKNFRLYCRYSYDDGEHTRFDSREEELKHFLTRISQKNNSWNKWPPPRFFSESYYCKYIHLTEKKNVLDFKMVIYYTIQCI